jgi:hypothetical protein
VLLGVGIVHEEFEPPSIERLGVPLRLREEELQALGRGIPSAHYRFGPGKTGQRLVAVAGQP